MDAHQGMEGSWMSSWMNSSYMADDQADILDSEGLSSLHHRFGGGDDHDSDDSSIYDPNQALSSSSSDESDYELQPDDLEISKKPKAKKKPRTYIKQRFKYNGRMCLISIPGALLLFLVTGDMLLTVLTIGSLVIYLLHIAENKEWATDAFLVTFICSLLTVVYAGVPFLWKSVFNMLLVGNVIMFTVLFGGWIYISLPIINLEEPDLVKFIEAMLFTLYPIVSVFLMTWVCVTLTSFNTAPYCLMLLGFAVLQCFLTPTLTSFHKQSHGDTVEHYIVRPPAVAGIAIVFCFFIPHVFLLIQALNGADHLLTVATFVEMVFIFAGSTFLASFFNLTQCMEFFGIDAESMNKLRLMAGVSLLILLGPVMSFHGFQSSLVPYVPAISLVLVLYGLMLSQKNKMLATVAAAIFIIVIIALVTMQFPWHLQYIVGGVLSIKVFYLLLFGHSLLCVLVVYASVYFTKDILGLLLLAESCCLLCTERLFVSDQNYSITAILATSCVGCYLLFKLYYNNKLLWQHVWLCLATLITKCTVVMDIVSISEAPHWPSVVVELTLSWAFFLVILYIFIFNNTSKATLKEMGMQAAAVGIITIVNAPGLLFKFLLLVCQEQPNVSSLAGLVGLILSSCWVWWSIHESTLKTRSILALPVCLVVSLALLALQPEVTYSMLAMEQWLLVVSLGCILTVVFLAKPVATDKSRASVLPSLLAFPPGVALCITIFPEAFTWQICTAYGVGAVLCVNIAIQAWRQLSDIDKAIINFSYGLVGVVLLALLQDALGEFSEDAQSSVNPGRLLAALVSVANAAVLKLWSKAGQRAVLTSQGHIRTSKIPLVGNLSTVASFVFLSLLSPFPMWDMWASLCSVTFLLLQRDHLVLTTHSHKNHLAPSLTVLSLILVFSTLYQTNLWHSKGFLLTLSGTVETSVVVLTSPFLFVFLMVAWRGVKEDASADKLASFLAPLFTIMFFVASSYSAMILGVLGMAAGIWLVFYAKCMCDEGVVHRG